jgi:hypothetical protein
MIISAKHYPGGFTFKRACPSNLGNRGLNPKGWRIMNLSFLILAFSRLLFHFLAFPSMVGFSKLMGWIILIGMSLSCIGLIVTSLVSEDHMFKVHFIAGTLYFVLAQVTGILFMLFLLIQIIISPIWPNPVAGIIILVILLLYGGWLLLLLATNKQPIRKRYDLEWYLFILVELWQWCYFLGLIL